MSEDVEELNQIVVVGYGTQKKSDVTGAIASVAQKDISNVRAANVVEAMQGKVAGVDMSRASGRAGSNYNILLRGAKSLVASNEPLYIVDGIQYSSNVDINPNDIESMEILKDASSTAVYGARGANGVIIITTRKGTKGEPRISFNTYQGITMPNGKAPVADRTYYLNYLSDVQWMKTINRNFGTIPDRDPNGYLNYLQPREKQGLEQGVDKNWYNELLKNGSQQDYNISISGGGEKLVYSVSLNHYLERGLTELDRFKRYNARFSLEAPIKKHLKVGTNSLVTYTQQSLQDNTLIVYGLQPNQNPTIPAGLTGLPNTPGNNPFNDARQLSPLLTGYNNNAGVLTDAKKEGPDANLIYYPNEPGTINTNPLLTSVKKYHFNEARSTKVFSTIYADINFLKDFSLRGAVNTELNFARQGVFNASFPGIGNQSNSEVNNNINTNYQTQLILNYNKQLGDHRIQVTAVNEVLYRRGEYFRTAVNNIALENSYWYGLGSQSGSPSPVLNLPDAPPQQQNYPLETRSLVSFLGRIFYSYKGKYSLQVSSRYDGASQLQKKWAMFPSASIAWNIMEESFIKDNVPLFSNLKLRIGYGISGNYSVNVFSTLGRVSTNPLYYNFGTADANALGYRTSWASNPGLGWEKTNAINLGLDYGILRNRIQGSVDIYETRTTGLLQNQLLSPASGIPRVTANVGETSNKGIELSLTSTNIQTTNFSWNTTATFARNVEKIIALSSGVSQDIANQWFVGQPTQVYYDRKKIGIWQLNEIDQAKAYGYLPGDIKFADLDNNPATVDRTIVGTPRPSFTAGLNNSLRYKFIDLNFFFFARVGHTILDAVTQTLQPDGRVAQMKVDYWTPTNPTNEYPRLDPARTNSGYTELSALRYTSGSFVKLRDITLGFTLPEAWVKRGKISRVRLYVTGKNLLIISPYFNKPGGRYDPELNGSIDTPLYKMYAAGLNFDF